MKHKKKKKSSFLDTQPRTPSAVLVAAKLATGAGAHGGGKRERNRRDRKASREALSRGDYD